MKYICNPININYRYQFILDSDRNQTVVSREAADPSMICFRGKYYIFASMTLGVWESDDMAEWHYHRLPDDLPLYDYAPDVCVAGKYVYFCASSNEKICNYYRTKDIIHGPYEEIPGPFDFWDPHLFRDEDGRFYFYWGCAWDTPIWGTELNPENMQPIGEKRALIWGDAFGKGFERIGEDHSQYPRTDIEIQEECEHFLRENGMTEDMVAPNEIMALKGKFCNRPYIEGPWMNKYKGLYYLQYACPGTEYNTYADGVYVSESPLGPFKPAENNPYSYHPGGFVPGAGHGSTMADVYGNLWHTATTRISVNHPFERRIGIWPAGFDADGELFCNQRYGDWPCELEQRKNDPWEKPKWFLLSYGKPVRASSSCKGKEAEYSTDENVQTWWRAASAVPGEWLELDLGKICSVYAIQINFADDKLEIPVLGEMQGKTLPRVIEERKMVTRWVLEGSEDGETYFVVKDKSEADTDLPHDLVVRENGIRTRYLRLTILEVPYHQQPCISGFRVFGKGDGKKPKAPEFAVRRTGDMDMEVEIAETNAIGYNILWGHNPEKLYHSYMTFGTEQKIGALVKGMDYYVRVDAFNENGITEGSHIVKLPSRQREVQR